MPSWLAGNTVSEKISLPPFVNESADRRRSKCSQLVKISLIGLGPDFPRITSPSFSYCPAKWGRKRGSGNAWKRILVTWHEEEIWHLCYRGWSNMFCEYKKNWITMNKWKPVLSQQIITSRHQFKCRKRGGKSLCLARILCNIQNLEDEKSLQILRRLS